MGKLNIFQITLTDQINLECVYYPGQTVSGYLTVELLEPMDMRGMRISFRGMAYVSWSEGSGDDRKSYSAKEDYFKEEVLVLGRLPNQDGMNVTLPMGRHTYPFKFQLPYGLPSSFEGIDGYVRYFVKGVIDKPMQFDHTVQKLFTVLTFLDLNTEPDVLCPLQGQNQKVLCCLCCASGPISAVFRIDRRGFVPGESVMISAEIDNKSNRQMDSSSVILNLVATFRAESSTTQHRTELAKIYHPGINPGDSDVWSGDKLVIPAAPPSQLVGCSIIDIKYVLELHVIPSGPSIELVVPLEIVIGTFPLRHILQQNPPLARAAACTDASLPPADKTMYSLPGQESPASAIVYPPGTPTDIPNLPPPTYSECAFGKVNVKNTGDNDHARGDQSYTPHYTYYNWL